MVCMECCMAAKLAGTTPACRHYASLQALRQLAGNLPDSRHFTSLQALQQLAGTAAALTLPAKGIRKGSVQKMALLASAIRLALTAIVSSIGSSAASRNAQLH
eukprot:GHRQ01028798.1.p1 GENE.GHRQ01028798.1~~GHRQ01028798.1.p1  ORF type:complete len:103 (-),score=15.68 GHRQ01028798.1:235-543(-)